MSRLLKRALALACIVAVLITCVACGNQQTTGTPSVTPSPSTATSGEPATPEPKQEPVKIKFYSTTNNYEVPSGDLKELPIMKVLQEKTNTIIDLQLLDHAKYEDILKTKFASGDYPDVFLKWSIAGDVAVENGLIEDMKPYIEQYGPNLKSNIDQATWDACTQADGSVLAIPSMAGTYSGSGSVLYVRQDWMDKAGVTADPKTPDELLDMWRKFRDSDFNGNGKPDEIPFSLREKVGWMGNLYSMWGLSENNYVYEDGEFKPAIVSSKMKEFLTFVSTAYREKLIDSEFLTNSQPVWNNKIIQNRVGSWNHVVSLATDWYVKLRDANGGKDVGLRAIATPKAPGYDGPVGAAIAPYGTVHMVFKSAGEDTKIAITKLFDYLSTEEGAILSKYGIEGDTFIKDASGNYTYDLEKRKQNQTLWFDPAFSTAPTEKIIDMVKSADPKEDLVRQQAISVAKLEGLPNLIAPMPAPKALSENPALAYNQTIIQEGLAKIITGEKPVDYWDEVVDKWMKSGGEKLIQETTAWYKNYHKIN